MKPAQKIDDSNHLDFNSLDVNSHAARMLRATELGLQVKSGRERTDRKRKPRKRRSKRKYKKDGIEYASLSERACVELMEKYISWYQVQQGVNYEIPIGTGKQGGELRADFKLDKTFVEFHHPRVWFFGRGLGDFSSLKQRRLCRRALDEAEGSRKAEIRDVIEKTLLNNYEVKRRKILNENPVFRDHDLLVIATPEQLFDKVLKVFANRPLPTKHRFLKQWHKIMRRLKREIGVPDGKNSQRVQPRTRRRDRAPLQRRSAQGQRGGSNILRGNFQDKRRVGTRRRA